MLRPQVSVVLFGDLVSAIVDSITQREDEAKRAAMKRKQLDSDLIESLDRNGDGVDKFEYVMGMLEICGIVTEKDYCTFANQFDLMAANGSAVDGRLCASELREIAASWRAKRAAVIEAAKKDAARLAQARLHRAAKRLIFPTGVLCASFVWHMFFGYILLGAGLLNGVVIIVVLGQPVSQSSVRSVTALTSAAGLTLVVAIGFVVARMASPREYVLHVDTMKKEIVLSRLREDGTSVDLLEGSEPYEAGLSRIEDDMHTWQELTLNAVYVCILAYILALNATLALMCVRALAAAPTVPRAKVATREVEVMAVPSS